MSIDDNRCALIIPAGDEQAALQALADLLTDCAGSGLRLVDADGREVILSDTAARLLHQAVPLLVSGHAVVVGGLGQRLTLEHAASQAPTMGYERDSSSAASTARNWRTVMT